jgi:hypothetical protein
LVGQLIVLASTHFNLAPNGYELAVRLGPAMEFAGLEFGARHVAMGQ